MPVDGGGSDTHLPPAPHAGPQAAGVRVSAGPVVLTKQALLPPTCAGRKLRVRQPGHGCRRGRALICVASLTCSPRSQTPSSHRDHIVRTAGLVLHNPASSPSAGDPEPQRPSATSGSLFTLRGHGGDVTPPTGKSALAGHWGSRTVAGVFLDEAGQEAVGTRRRGIPDCSSGPQGSGPW